MASYRLGGVKATFSQKQDFIYDLLDTGHDIDVFVGYALTRLTWREVQDIGYHMVTIRNRNEETNKALLIKEIERVWENPTDEEKINA
jgi:hypothetical protein